MGDTYDEWQGVAVLEVQLVLRATSGRPKHTDPQEQGAMLAETVKRSLQDEFGGQLDVSIGNVRMSGLREEAWFDLGDDLLS